MSIGSWLDAHARVDFLPRAPTFPVTADFAFTTVHEDGRSLSNTGALASGRRLFDITDGWGDNHPVGAAPVVVVTHQAPEDTDRWPRTTFVDDVEKAITNAKEIAGSLDVTVASANVAQQALALGLVDEVCVSLVPVLFGDGISYFANLDIGHQLLDDPVVTQGRRALHLKYRVRR